MASAAKKSLVGRAGAAARKVVSRGSAAKKSAGTAAKSPAKTAAPKAAPAKKTTTKATPAKKTAAKKTPATKATPATKSAATTRAAPAKKAPAKKNPVSKKTPATKTPATKAAAAKAPATKSAPAKKSAPAATQAATTTKKASVTTTAAKKAPATTAKKAPATTAKKAPAATSSTRAPSPATLVVLEQESPWTKAELGAVRKTLNDDVTRLTGELAEVEGDLAGMIENSGEGAGNDQADVGSASFERDQEMVIVNNARDMLEQSQHALERIADGSYGQCEICGNPIGKNRLMAFPRATLCLSCKQREERR